MGAEQTITVTVNGVPYTRTVPVKRLLAEFLREDLDLTGTHIGCGQGLCGCCTVIVDGRPAKSCLMLAVQADGCQVETIEGLARGGQLHPLQEAFVACGAVQCGFCIPGMIMTARALLDENPDPTEREIREELANNLCRCTGYVKIVEAVQAAANQMKGTAGAGAAPTRRRSGTDG